MSDLEKRIAAALGADIPSAELDALITETQDAIAEAEATAETEREKALDLTASPDAKAAREAAATAEFARDRLHRVLPRLESKCRTAAAAEHLAKWRADYEALKIERDALAAEFAEVYPAWERKIADLLTRCSDLAPKLSRLHQARPGGEGVHLLEPELVARGLDRFTRDAPSIATELRVPKFAKDARLAWPPWRV